MSKIIKIIAAMPIFRRLLFVLLLYSCVRMSSDYIEFIQFAMIISIIN